MVALQGDIKSVKDKSMFGKQISSTKASHPAFGFGTSRRMPSTTLLFTKAQTARNVGKEGPGPVYDLPSSIGAQSSSRNHTSPSHKFSSRAHFESSDEGQASKAKGSRKVPGPGQYTALSSIGQQVKSQNKSSHRFGFGRSNRWSSLSKDFKEAYMTPGSTSARLASGWLGGAPSYSFGSSQRHQFRGKKSSPGPGHYTAPSSIGGQRNSKQRSSHEFRFGSTTRAMATKVYLTGAHERAYVGLQSPGCNYSVMSSVGSQVSSRAQTAPSFSFGSSDRFSQMRSRSGQLPTLTPGPGSYGT